LIEAPLDSGPSMVAQMRVELGDWGIPVLAVLMLIPLISGMATGLAVGFVGASFPIVLSLLGEAPSLGTVLSTTVLVYGFGYTGMILSPVHVCLIVTNEHFSTPVPRALAGLVWPCVVVLCATVALYGVVAGLAALLP